MCHVLDREVREGSHINYGLVSHEVGIGRYSMSA